VSEKSKLTLKIDSEVKELAKDKYNVSQTVEKYLKEIVSGPDRKEDRIEQINDRIKEHKDAISDRQRKISNLQSEKQVLEKQMKQEAKVTDEKHKFFKIAKRNIGDTWSSPEDIPVYWRSKFDESVEELWKLAKNSDADPRKPKKEDSDSFTSAEVNSV